MKLIINMKLIIIVTLIIIIYHYNFIHSDCLIFYFHILRILKISEMSKK